MVWEGIRPLVRYREAWKGRLLEELVMGATCMPSDLV